MESCMFLHLAKAKPMRLLGPSFCVGRAGLCVYRHFWQCIFSSVSSLPWINPLAALPIACCCWVGCFCVHNKSEDAGLETPLYNSAFEQQIKFCVTVAIYSCILFHFVIARCKVTQFLLAYNLRATSRVQFLSLWEGFAIAFFFFFLRVGGGA